MLPKMERQRFRESKVLLCPQTTLTANTDDGRWCSAPGVSFEASSLGKAARGLVISEIVLRQRCLGDKELPVEKWCFERKHSALTGAVLCVSEVAESIMMMLSDPAAICKASLKYCIPLDSQLSFLSPAYLPSVSVARGGEGHC